MVARGVASLLAGQPNAALRKLTPVTSTVGPNVRRRQNLCMRA